MPDGLHKYAGQKVRQRGSSSKFVTLNNAFISAQSELGLEQAKEDPAYWGRLVESAVGAHIVNEARSGGYEVYYWREGEREVDYVVKTGASIAVLEVKSGRDSGSRSGLEAFTKSFRPKQV
jgi:predicted AAA+ superfamily ATPase